LHFVSFFLALSDIRANFFLGAALYGRQCFTVLYSWLNGENDSELNCQDVPLEPISEPWSQEITLVYLP